MSLAVDSDMFSKISCWPRPSFLANFTRRASISPYFLASEQEAISYRVVRVVLVRSLIWLLTIPWR